MSDSSPISGDTPSCSQCGKPLSKRDEDRSTCNDCRSARGKLADLDIAIRASGDDPKRLPEWIDIQHFLRKRFGEQSDLELWYRFRGWLSVERGFSEEEYLLLPLDEVKDLLADESAFIETAGDPVDATLCQVCEGGGRKDGDWCPTCQGKMWIPLVSDPTTSHQSNQ